MMRVAVFLVMATTSLKHRVQHTKHRITGDNRRWQTTSQKT